MVDGISSRSSTFPFFLQAWSIAAAGPRNRCGGYLIVWLLIIVSSFFQTCQRPVASAIDGGIICNRIPGLVPEQRKLCRSYPDAMAAVGVGANLGLEECRFQFRYNRWNCSVAKDAEGPLQLVSTIGKKRARWRHISKLLCAYLITLWLHCTLVVPGRCLDEGGGRR